uniref:Genome polyprotein n=1 Tax=Solenopsis invicta virus 16 TaxID=2810812 RepID=A0A891H5G2_9VIRU|nr:polyprotein [Solenopsis invicta virus 16]
MVRRVSRSHRNWLLEEQAIFMATYHPHGVTWASRTAYANCVPQPSARCEAPTPKPSPKEIKPVRKNRKPQFDARSIYSGPNFWPALEARSLSGSSTATDLKIAKAFLKPWKGCSVSHPDSRKRIPTQLLPRLRICNRVIEVRAAKHQQMLDMHSARKGYSCLLEPISNMAPGVVRATSSKQKKVRHGPIPEPVGLLREEGAYAPVQEVGTNSRPALKNVSKRAVNMAITLQALERTPLGKTIALAIVATQAKRLAALDPFFFEKLEDMVAQEKIEQAPSAEEESVLPQMDNENAQGIATGLTSDVQGNVVIEHEEVASHTTTDSSSLSILNMCSASELQTINRMTNRWLLIDNFVWKASDQRLKLLKSYPLPEIALRSNFSSPNIISFLVHRYGRINKMVVKLEPTSNRFQVGKLTSSFFFNSQMYRTDFDNKGERIPILQGRNLHSATQRNYVDIDASTSNPARLEIPYFQLWSLANLKKDNFDNGSIRQLCYGNLDIFVKNELKAATNVSSEVDVAVYVAFVDPELRGVLDRELDLPLPQMDVIADGVAFAEDALKLVKPVLNMDKPPVAENKIFVQPLASQSLAYMDDSVERLQAMRITPVAQTPDFGMSNMCEFKNQIRTWSLLKKFEWSSGDVAKKLLFSMAVEPVFDLKVYENSVVNSQTFYHLPILSCLSSAFGYWSGDIEIKFEFVNTMFHTGAIQVSILPGVIQNQELKIAKNSHSSIFKLKDVKEYIFNAPYFSMMPAWPVRKAGEYYPGAPSVLNVYVLNSLTSTDQIPSNIDVNVYIRGGDNFSLSIPSPSPFALPWYKLIRPSGDKHVAHVLYSWSQMFTSGSRWTPMTGGGEALCLFYNQTTDYFTQFSNFQFGKVYAVPQSTVPYAGTGGDAQYFKLPYYKTSTEQAEVKYICRLYQYPNWPVAICFDTVEKARSYVGDKDVNHGIKEVAQGGWAQRKVGTGDWLNITSDQLVKVPFIEVAAAGASDFVFLPNMDVDSDIAPVIKVEKPATSSQAGKLIFGENVTNVKSYGRRYFHYGCLADVKPSKGSCIGNAIALAKISCHPVRLLDLRDSSASSKSRDNRIREGTLGLLLSPFVGYRGGLRYKVIVASAPDKTDASFTLVHKFQEALDVQHGSIQEISGQAIDRTTYIDSTYATALQSIDVNPILDIEVPFYKPGPWSSISFPAISDAFTSHYYHGNGNLYLYINKVKDSITFDVDVFSSLADDFEVACWQGYPPLMSTSDVSPEPQGPETHDFRPQGFFSDILRVPESVKKAADTITENVAPVGNKIVETLDSIQKTISDFDPLKGLNSLLQSCKGYGFALLSQILHIIASPSWKTIAISLVSILAILGGGYSLIINSNELWDAIKNLFAFAKTTPFVPNGDDEQQQSPDTLAKVLALVWSIVCTAMGVKAKNPGGSVLKGLFINSSNVFRAHVFGVKFFQDFIYLIKRCFQWINMEQSKTTAFYNMAKDQEKLKDWFIACEVLSSPQNQEYVQTMQEWQEKLFATFATGELFYLSAMQTPNIAPQLRTAISVTYLKLKNKVQEMIDKRAYLPIRCCPVVFWLHGLGGLGKSEFFQEFIRVKAVEMGINPHIFELSAGNKYFDLLDKQNTILFDDFLNVKGGESEADNLSQFQKSVGSAPISYPRSAVDDKKRSDNPHIIGITSNQSGFADVNCIRNKEAFSRRVHFWVELVPTDPNYVASTMSPLTFDKGMRKIKIQIIGEKTIHEFRDDKKAFDFLAVHYNTFRQKFVSQYLSAMAQLNDSISRSVKKSRNFEEFCDELKNCLENQDNLSFTAKISERIRNLFGKVDCEKKEEEAVEDDEIPSTSGQNEEQNPQQDNLEDHQPLPNGLAEDDPTAIEIIEALKSAGFIISNDDLTLPDDADQAAMFKKHRKLIATFYAKKRSNFNANFNSRSDRWDGNNLYDGPFADQCPNPVWLYGNSKMEQLSKLINHFNLSLEKECDHNMDGIENYVYVPFTQDFISWVLNSSDSWYAQNHKRVHRKQIIVYGVLWNPGSGHVQDVIRCRGFENIRDQFFDFKRSYCKLQTSGIVNHLYSKYLKHDHFRRNSHIIGPLSTPEPEQIQCHMPQIYWDVFIKPLVARLKLDIKDAIPMERRFDIEELVDEHFPRDLVEVDGVYHIVTPDEVRAGELLGEKRIKVIPGMYIRKNVKLLKDKNPDNDKLMEQTDLQIAPVLKFLIHLAAYIAFCWAIGKFISIIFGVMKSWSLFSEMVPNISASGDTVQNRPRASAFVKAARLLGSSPNGVEDDVFVGEIKNENSSVLRMVANNCVFLICYREKEDGTIETKRGRCLGLKGKQVLILDHYLEQFNSLYNLDNKWQFSVVSAKSGGPLKLELKEIEQIKVQGTGYSLINLPPRFPIQFRDITKKFSREGPVSCPRQLTLLTVVGMDQNSMNANYSVRMVNSSIKMSSQNIGSLGAMQGWSVSAHYEYDFAGRGICGSILIDLDDQRTPIRAIHTAGIGNRVGIGEFLHTETFNIDKENNLEFVTPNMEIDQKEYAPEGAVVVGHVDPSMRVVTPSKTKIRPSLLHGVLPTKTVPAPLHGNDERIKDLNIKPLIEGVKNRLKPVKEFPSWAVKLAVEDYKNLILCNCKPVRNECNKLSIEESVMGCNVPFMEKIDMHTSEGYPWVKMRPEGFKNKSWLFKLNENKDKLLGINPQLQSILELKEKLRAQGKVPASWYTGCLKDARIAKEKELIPGATRLFEMSAVDLTLAQRSYHLDFYASFMENRRQCENTVGININGSEWSLLASDLLSISNNILAGDYSKYGPRLNQTILFEALKIIKLWCKQNWKEFTEEDDISFDALAEEIVHGFLIVDRTVLRVCAGLMSGNSGTVILNSMVNSIYMRIVYLLIMNDKCKQMASLNYFNQNTQFFFNGDDLVGSVSDEIVEFFNNQTIANTFAKFDIKYTNSQKNKEVVPFESITDVTFLKAQFRHHPNRFGEWLAAMDKVSIEDCFQWVWESRVSLQDRTIENCDQAIRLAYGRGREYFDQLRNLLIQELCKLNIFSSFPTWDVLDYQVWEEKMSILNFGKVN